MAGRTTPTGIGGAIPGRFTEDATRTIEPRPQRIRRGTTGGHTTAIIAGTSRSAIRKVRENGLVAITVAEAERTASTTHEIGRKIGVVISLVARSLIAADRFSIVRPITAVETITNIRRIHLSLDRRADPIRHIHRHRTTSLRGRRIGRNASQNMPRQGRQIP
jgi:hypothetical protein